MSGSVLNPRRLAVLYYFGDLSYWKLPEIAAEALAGGFDGAALRKLAGLTNVSESDICSAEVDAAFKEMGDAAFKEMGVAAPISKDDARLALATECAKEAITGESNVFDAATHIRVHLCAWEDSPPELYRIIELSQLAKTAPRRAWDVLEGELKTALSRFLESQSLLSEPAP